MGRGFQITITGNKQLEKAFKEIEPKLQRKILRKSMKPAMLPVLHQMINTSPFLTGALKENFKLWIQRGKRGKFSVVVGTKGEYALKKQGLKGGLNQGDQFYAAFYELGTSHQPARPFMRPALDNNKSLIIRIFSDKLAKEIIKETTVD